MKQFKILRERLNAEMETQKQAYRHYVDGKRWGIADVFMGRVAELEDVMKILDEVEEQTEGKSV